jgi:cyclopropane-fatty-acyl-phospholipid synthase
MAEREDLDFTYSLIDRVFRLSLGELADFSGAKYDGDFSLSLEEAQRRKHEYVAEQIGIGRGRRVLDLGCGWGPLLAFVRSRGGSGVGVAPARRQRSGRWPRARSGWRRPGWAARSSTRGTAAA